MTTRRDIDEDAISGVLLVAAVIVMLIVLAALFAWGPRSAHGAGFPEGMHRASITTNTVYLPHLTPASAWLDSVVRADSLKAKRKRK